MEIKRVNDYEDERFSKKVLCQHGGFLIDGAPYEVEIISEFEAIVRGEAPACFAALIEQFRFFTPHIYKFYDANRNVVKEYPAVKLLELPLERIQPSQFYVDEDKIAAIRSFIHKPQDSIIQVATYGDRYVSLDGHTRLYYAVLNGWKSVRAVVDAADNNWTLRFVEEAQKRSIFQPKDMILVPHAEYEEKWNRFCDEMFAE